MQNLESFDQLRRELNASNTVAAALELFDTVRALVPEWDESKCLGWMTSLIGWLQDSLDGFEATRRHLLAVRRDDDQLEPDDVIARGDRLFEDLLDRLSALRVDPLPGEVHEHVVSEICIPNPFEIPRRYLIGWYREWCEDGMVPGVFEYASQVMDKATRPERVDIAELVRSIGGQVSEVAPYWIRSTMSDAITVRPGVVPRWLQFLREEYGDYADAGDVAFIEYWEGWLRRLPSPGTDLPSKVVEWLACPGLDRDAVAAARLAIDSSETSVFSLPREHLDGLLQRDLGVLNPGLPAHLAGAQEVTRRMLQTYLRLEACGGAPPAAACALLSLAIEAELRWALSRGLEGDDRHRIQECGLRGLVRLVESEPVDKLRGLRVTGEVSKELKRFLHRAGRVRNAVHHDAGSVKSNDKASLRRAIFDVDERALRVISQFAGLRCTAKKTGH